MTDGRWAEGTWSGTRVRVGLGAGVAGVLVLAIAVGETLSGGAGHPPGAATSLSGTGAFAAPAVDADREPRDVTALTTDATDATPSPRTSPVRSVPAATTLLPTPLPTPLTWQQQVALHPDAPVRLNPLAGDWAVEQIVISHDLAGKFVGRVNVRYTGPGAATGTFAVSLLRDGKVLTTLTGAVPGEVRSGVYPVILYSTADFVEGPWTTQFRVVSTS